MRKVGLNTNFFPSPRLGRYCAKLYLQRLFAVLFCLVLVLLALDMLGESGKILAVRSNTQADVWHYAALRLPMLLSSNLPRAALLGTLITFVTLNQNSEIVSMKAVGLSAHQIIAPLIAVSLPLAAVLFVFNEHVVTNSVRQLTGWQNNDYKPLPPASLSTSNAWITNGDDMIRANLVTGSGINTRLQGISIYDRQGNSIQRLISADKAEQEDGAWRLENVRIYTSGENVVRHLASMRGLVGVEPARFTLAKVDPESRSFGDLRSDINELVAAGRQTGAVETGYWHKLSAPLSLILMPLLGALAAFGLARSGQVLTRAAIGMALGFAYFVADNFALAMGDSGTYPPLLAAWAPFALFLLIGETVLIRSEE